LKTAPFRFYIQNGKAKKEPEKSGISPENRIISLVEWNISPEKRLISLGNPDISLGKRIISPEK
jgi:hypothetical protein